MFRSNQQHHQPLQSSVDSYNEEISLEFSFHNLQKHYSIHTKFKRQHFKMLTSLDRDEPSCLYLEDDKDTELVDELKENILRSVKFFQKTYYQEAIRGQHIRVPAWRMKEKVVLDFIHFLSLYLFLS